MTLADDLAALGGGAGIVAGTAKVLCLDIERIPGLAYLWQPKTSYVSPRQFQSWPRMICFAAKWYAHPTKIMFHAEWHKGGHPSMVRKAWELVDAADIVVGYNSQSFDMKHLTSDWMAYRIPPPSPYRDVDLYRHIKRLAGWESKSLDSVTKFLGMDGKQSHYSIDMALAALAGDRESRRRLREYNIADVVDLTLPLYDRLRPWLKGHPHLGSWGDEERCPMCGSDDLKPQRKRYRAVMLEYRLLRCQHCGANVRGNYEARQASTRGV